MMDDSPDSTEGEEDEDKKNEGAGRFVPTEQRESVSSTRRSDEDRREDKESFEGEEKRETSDRRTKPDRRTMSLEVTCKTSGSISNIEDWLDDNCESGWKVVLQKIDDDMVNKHLNVMFETKADRDTFLDKYLKGAQ